MSHNKRKRLNIVVGEVITYPTKHGKEVATVTADHYILGTAVHVMTLRLENGKEIEYKAKDLYIKARHVIELPQPEKNRLTKDKERRKKIADKICVDRPKGV